MCARENNKHAINNYVYRDIRRMLLDGLRVELARRRSVAMLLLLCGVHRLRRRLSVALLLLLLWGVQRLRRRLLLLLLRLFRRYKLLLVLVRDKIVGFVGCCEYTSRQ